MHGAYEFFVSLTRYVYRPRVSYKRRVRFAADFMHPAWFADPYPHRDRTIAVFRCDKTTPNDAIQRIFLTGGASLKVIFSKESMKSISSGLSKSVFTFNLSDSHRMNHFRCRKGVSTSMSVQ